MSEQFNADLDIIQATPIELELLDGNLNIIQQLDDEPNDVGGLTSAELKSKFDQAGNTIKQYINEKLIPAILASDATEMERIAAEEARVSAEDARIAAEELRVAAEPLRISAENERLAAETVRIEAEAARISAEELRIAAEPLRLSAEMDRVSNEDLRQGNERTRESNEEARQQNEESRRQREADLYVWEDFNETRTYRPGNKVCYAGSSYVCLAECTGIYPTSAVEAGGIRYWQLVALRGDTGEGSSGDMEKAIYDPTNKAQDVFAYADGKVAALRAAVMLESVPAKFLDGLGTNSIVFNDTYRVFVAVISGYIFTSTTGEVWSTTKISIPANSPYTRVLLDKTTGNMVVVNTSAATTGYHSTDGGLTWTKFTIENPDNVPMSSSQGCVYHNGKFVTIDWDGNVSVHVFNGSLSRRYSAASCGLAVEGQHWAGMFLCGGKFWAMPSSGGKKVAYSSNGLTWTLIDTPFGNASGMKAYVEDGNYCLINPTSNYGFETRDGGLTWTSAALPIERLVSISIGMLLHAGEVYICGQSWYAHRPRDTKIWNITRTKDYKYGHSEGMETGCAFGNGRFIRTYREVNRTYGGYHTSTDFSNWVGSAILQDVSGADVSEIIRHALMSGQIKVYSYIGIGTYGSDSPSKIEADFPIGALVLLDSGCQVVDMLALTENYVAGAGFNGCYCKRSEDYKSVMWYSTTSAANQVNTANRAYHLLVIS